MKTLALFLAAVVLVGAGCTQPSTTPLDESPGSAEQTQESNIPVVGDGDLRGAHSYQAISTNETLYTSSIYHFEITLPASWGALHEDVEDGPTDAFEAAVTISSLEDPGRFVTVYVVPDANKADPNVNDLPAVRMDDSNSVYTYLVSGAHDMTGDVAETEEIETIQSEVNDVRESFRSTL